MKVSLPRDIRYVATARLIAVESAREAGCAGASADAFVIEVEDAARGCLSASASQPHVMLAVERTPDAVVVTIDHLTMRLTI